MSYDRDLQYEKELMSYLDERMPEKIYDCHFHINPRKNGNPEKPMPQYEQYIRHCEEVNILKRLDGGLVMGPPLSEDLADGDNEFILNLAKEHNLDMGFLVPPQTPKAKVEKILDENPCIRALKPYLTYLPMEVRYESDILDFAPEWIWEIANERKMPVVIHISHYQNMLYEKANYEQIIYLSEKYPDAKIVLAHCVLGHHVRKLILGLEKIKHLKNIWIDCSGCAETLSIYHCIKTFGVDRMMFATDFDFGAVTGKLCSYGSNFYGAHYGCDMLKFENFPHDYKYQPLKVSVEVLTALFDAIDILSLSKEDVEKIFYYNAKELYSAK